MRLLLDDIDTSSYDHFTLALSKHENIEIRLYNPFWRDRSLILAGLFDFKRINRRMHNKSMTADNAITIVGGRNIGEEYFLAREDMNYIDLDLLAVGPVVDDVSQSFDAYWNSEFAVPAKDVITKKSDVTLDEARQRLRDFVKEVRDTSYARSIRLAADKNFRNKPLKLTWVPARFYADPPSKTGREATTEPTLVSQLIPYFERARREVNIVSAYFVPRTSGVDWMAELEDRGVGVTVVTNSLKSNDVPPVYAHYAKKRKQLLRNGVELFELRPDAHAMQKRGLYWWQSRSGLHTKAFTIDDRYLFIGSFNWDPRSININTELGIMIDSRRMAANVNEMLDTYLPELTYEVLLDDSGAVVWKEHLADGETFLHKSEPTGSLWNKMTASFYSILPIGSQL